MFSSSRVSDGVASNDTLSISQNEEFQSRASQMVIDLLNLVLSRLDYFYEQNIATAGNFIVVQVLIFMKTLSMKKNPDHEEVIDNCRARLEDLLLQHDQQVDKKTKSLLKYYQEK